MHPILVRQLKRSGLDGRTPPTDAGRWGSLLEAVSNAYEQADQDRYLLERSLSLSSEEMGELHAQLAAERDSISAVICSLGEGVCAIDRECRVLFINPEARRLLRISEDADVTSCPLCKQVDAAFADGMRLPEVICADQRPEPEEGEGSRLIVGGDTSTFITCGITPLGQQREGLVLTLRDVTARKRMEQERYDLNKRLLELSRRAGMAEVASDVLHNVGNVLNSVNVSCSVAFETVKTSKAGGVARVASLLAENRGRLPEFLTSDAAGAKVPEYLGKLGEQLGRERDRLMHELNALRQSTDHIREIVATQQSLAKGGGVPELEDIAALMEEAIRVADPGLAKRGVRVVRRFSPVPAVHVERHQVLQIFINLVNNAKDALASVPEGERVITARVAYESGRVVAQVIDGGCGIPPENLTRVFSHGFTTRKDGHGFGLHSAALAAKAMGGSINADSEGVGKGATFTVEFPSGHTPHARAA